MEQETKQCTQCGEHKPLDQFSRNRFGYTSVCQQCVSSKRKETFSSHLQNERQLKLSDFTPRELMLELKHRGYEGTLRYIQIHNIDITKLD